MDELKQALDILSHATNGKFPKEQINIIKKYKEEAKPYLYQAIDKVIEKKGHDKDDVLYLYAIYLLAEFEDQEAFLRIVSLVSLPEKILDSLLGDVITQDLSDIFYATYNGQMDVLKGLIRNQRTYQYVAVSAMEVLIQLYLDGKYEEKEFKQFLEELIYTTSQLHYFVYTSIGGYICELHFMDMLKDVKHLYYQGKINPQVFGTYDTLIDLMFDYTYPREYCQLPVDTYKRMRFWSMFEQKKQEMPDLNAFIKQQKQQALKAKKKVKIGRNEPCPCGSGKKYKNCCLNKPKSELDQIESLENRQRLLKGYPKPRNKQYPDRIYIDDYYDQESIQIDQLVYLALHHREVPIWEKELTLTPDKKQAYLLLALDKYVEKMKKENIDTMLAYDQKYEIHYSSQQWINELLRGLNKNSQTYQKVMEKCQLIKDFNR